MHFYFWRPGGEPGVDHESIWGAIGLFALAAARFVPGELTAWYVCPFRHLTGFPCVTCGATRAFRHMVRLDVTAAFELNPLAALFSILVGAYVLYAAVVLLFRLPRLRLKVDSPGLRWTMRLAFPAVLLANWAYMLVNGVG